jgi:hypothetical protein
METYDDEAEVLEAAMKALRTAGQGERAAAISDTRRLVAALRGADERLASGEGAVTVIDAANAEGASERVDEIGND